MARSQNKLFLIIALIAGAALFFGGGLFPTASLSNPNGVPSIVNSISAVNQSGSNVFLISNDEQLASTRFLISTTVGNGTGGAQDIQANFAPSGPQNLSFTKNVRVRVNEITEYLTYGINNTVDSLPLYKFVATVTNGTNCPAGTTYPIKRANWNPLANDWYCINEVQVATKSSLTEYVYKADALVAVVSGGATATTSISSQNGTYPSSSSLSANGKPFGTVQWVKQDPTSFGPPMPNTTLFPYVASGSSTWKLASRSAFEQYQQAYPVIQTKLGQLKTDGFAPGFSFNLQVLNITFPSCSGEECDSQIVNIISAHNGIINQITGSDKPISYAAGTLSTQKVGSGVNQKFSVTLNNGLFFTPTINYYLNSDTLGVVIDVGKPHILSVDPTTISFPVGSTGTTQTFVVKVENQSDVRGSFGISFGACPGVTLTSTSDGLVGPNGILNILVTATTTSGASLGTMTCPFKVSENSRADTYFENSSIGINLTQSQDCVPPGKQFRAGDTVRQCNANGIGSFLLKDCPYGMKLAADGVTYECQAEPNKCGNGFCDLGENLTCKEDCTPPPICNGNNICDTANGETCTNCPSECGVCECIGSNCNKDTCKFYETLSTKVTPQYAFEMGPLKLIQTGTTVVNQCVLDPIYPTLVILVLGVGIIYVFVIKKPKKRRGS
jgi:hypothetical protein